jgi:hypothetical protein
VSKVRARLLCALTFATALGAAAPALADSTTSANWSGYAAHHAHVTFRKVYASWTQPSVSCVSGSSTYSAFWVGLGGYSLNSEALEQIGTEADCRASGRSTMSAWYELVPNPSRPLSLRVSGGDRLAASVTVTGHKVVLALQNVTTRKSVVKTVHASQVDVSSAEWIAEAPSSCVTANSCQTLPLADFGSAGFQSAGAQAAGAAKTGLDNRRWTLTKITLEPSGQRFIGLQGSGSAAGAATPSAVTAKGTAFTITYVPVSSAPPFYAADVASSRLFH